MCQNDPLEEQRVEGHKDEDKWPSPIACRWMAASDDAVTMTMMMMIQVILIYYNIDILLNIIFINIDKTY